MFFCVVKPLYEQFFEWNFCVDIGSEGKILKSVQNSFFYCKNEDKSLGDVKYPFPGKKWAFLVLFQAHGKNVLIKIVVHTCVFQENHIFLGKMQEIGVSKAYIGSLQQILVKYLPFPHSGIS